jgi:hypothetical protein
MISFFSVPKPFAGHTEIIQRNAISNWSRAAPGAEVLLFGDEAGTAEAAAATEALHVPRLRRSPHGAPLLDDVFREAARLAAHDTLCFVNTDIVFRGDVSGAVATAATIAPFLVIGESADMDVRTAVPFDRTDWRLSLSGEKKRRGPLALDYFFFSRGVFTDVPPFALGRARFDNWLVWRAIDRGISVIDATRAIDAIHQLHDYGHLPGGRREAYEGPDAKRNQSLAGFWCYLHLYSVLDARFNLSSDGLQRRDWRFSFLRQIWCRSCGFVESRRAEPRPRRGASAG